VIVENMQLRVQRGQTWLDHDVVHDGQVHASNHWKQELSRADLFRA
jgi:hypothetical protein